MRTPVTQKHFIVLLEMPKGGIRNISVRASSSDIAGKRAMKRVPSAVKVHRVEQGG